MAGMMPRITGALLLLALFQTALTQRNRDQLRRAEAEVVATMRQRGELAENGPRVSSTNPFLAVSRFSGGNRRAFRLSVNAEVETQVLVDDGFTSKASVETYLATDPVVLSETVTDNSVVTNPLACPFAKNVDCDTQSTYRTLDGTCNNLGTGPSDRKRQWGSAYTPMTRMMNPDYADGFNSPRVASNGGSLPSARDVSNVVFDSARSTPNPALSLFHMTFGQFLDHDIGHIGTTQISADGTENGELLSVACGDNGCSTNGVENAACFPIPLRRNDPLTTEGPCLMFVRSLSSPSESCTLTGRQQINQITSFLDASQVYGSTEEENAPLRDLSDPSRGRLLVTPQSGGRKPLLPQDRSPSACPFARAPDYCFKAGDGRCNEQVGLTSMHTVWHRHHNTIEQQLHDLNPGWAGETLYQESRRVVGAIWQRIVFNEWLHLVVGPEHMTTYGLHLRGTGHTHDYNASANAGAINVFQTAAMRYGHSEVADFLKIARNDFTTITEAALTSEFFRPNRLYETYGTTSGSTSGVDSIVFGQLSDSAQNADEGIVDAIRNQLFTVSPPNGLGTDLAALNIQRGRDHGLPGYTAWRRTCGLSVPTSFNGMTDIPRNIRNDLANLYNNVDDVDVYAGGLSERNMLAGRVGPLFACIIAKQFKQFKTGDRFWHENGDGTGRFTTAQLTQIRTMTLARVLCDNLDNLQTVQRLALLKPRQDATNAGLSQKDADSMYGVGEDNPRVRCGNIPRMDFSAWRDNSAAAAPAPTPAPAPARPPTNQQPLPTNLQRPRPPNQQQQPLLNNRRPQPRSQDVTKEEARELIELLNRALD